MVLDKIIETWHINNRVNLKLIDAINDEGLECTLSTRGGRNVALQFAHMHYVRLWRLKTYAKDYLEDQSFIDIEKEVDRALLKLRLNESAEAIAKWLEQRSDENLNIKGFKRGVIPMLGYFISHEAHHRGNILLTIKQCGHNIPQAERYALWEWNKI